MYKALRSPRTVNSRKPPFRSRLCRSRADILLFCPFLPPLTESFLFTFFFTPCLKLAESIAGHMENAGPKTAGPGAGIRKRSNLFVVYDVLSPSADSPSVPVLLSRCPEKHSSSAYHGFSFIFCINLEKISQNGKKQSRK